VENQKTLVAIDEPPPYVPAPKSLINNQAATEVAAVNTGITSNAKPGPAELENLAL